MPIVISPIYLFAKRNSIEFIKSIAVKVIDNPGQNLIANLANNNGETIKDSWIGLKGKKIAQKLTLKHGLTPALTKNLTLTNLENLNEKEANRYVIYQAISDTLPHCKNLNELQHLLENCGIQTMYKYKGETEDLQGISFKIGEYKFKGSSIDRLYSLVNLQHAIEANKFKQELSPGLKNLNTKKLTHQYEQTLSKESRLQSLKIITDIVKPERMLEQISYELKRKRKKKCHGL